MRPKDNRHDLGTGGKSKGKDAPADELGSCLTGQEGGGFLASFLLEIARSLWIILLS